MQLGCLKSLFSLRQGGLQLKFIQTKGFIPALHLFTNIIASQLSNVHSFPQICHHFVATLCDHISYREQYLGVVTIGPYHHHNRNLTAVLNQHAKTVVRSLIFIHHSTLSPLQVQVTITLLVLLDRLISIVSQVPRRLLK